MEQQKQTSKIHPILCGVAALVMTLALGTAGAKTVVPVDFDSLTTVSALTSPVVNVSTYEELIAQISAYDVVELDLTGNITIPNDTSITIPVGKDITIELNGHTLSGRSTLASGFALFTNNGKLTVKDNTDTEKDGTGTGKIYFFAEQPDTKPSPTYASNLLNNKGTFILEGGLITNSTSTSGAAAANTIDNSSNSSHDVEIILNGGQIYSESSVGVRLITTASAYDNRITVNGGVVDGIVGIQIQVTNAAPKSAIIVNDGVVKGVNYAAFVYDGSQQENDVRFEVNGGKFEGYYAAYVYTAFGDVTINDGDFAGTSAAFYYYDGHTSTPIDPSNKIVINDGNFTTTVNDGTPLYLYNNYADLEINGGTFTGDYPIYYYASRDAGKVTTTINGGTFDGYNLFYAAYINDPVAGGTSNVIINDGYFTGDMYMYGYSGSWYFADNVQFINGGYFTEKDGMYWPLYIPADKHISDTPPYTFGFEVTLDPNYEGGVEQKIITQSTGQLSGLIPLSRDGYEFVGWNTEADGSGMTVTTESVVSGDTTIYAQWKEIVIPPEPVPTPDDPPVPATGENEDTPAVPNTGKVQYYDNVSSGTTAVISLIVLYLCGFGVVLVANAILFAKKKR